jgi:hypothetical protein
MIGVWLTVELGSCLPGFPIDPDDEIPDRTSRNSAVGFWRLRERTDSDRCKSLLGIDCNNAHYDVPGKHVPIGFPRLRTQAHSAKVELVIVRYKKLPPRDSRGEQSHAVRILAVRGAKSGF